VKIQIIVNASVGKGQGEKIFPLLKRKFEDRDLAADFTLSYHPQEALAIALAAQKRGADLLVACGGDGTVHWLLPALVNRPVTLGVIPLGTANDLARNWGIPLDINGAVDLLAKGQPKTIDVIETRSGIYIAGAGGVGFDAAVIQRGLPWRQRWKGVFPFLPAILLEFFKYRSPLVTVAAGQWRYDGPAWQVIFTKISRYALLLQISSSVKMDDGLMEICLVPGLPKSYILMRALLFPFWGFRSLPAAQFFSASTVVIESSPPLKFHGDGELIGQTPAIFRVLPKALRVMMPEDSKA